MTTLPYIKWYGAAWRSDPRLRLCSPAARGVWADCLSLMIEAEPYGHLAIDGRAMTAEQFGSLTSTPAKAVKVAWAELDSNGVCSHDDNGLMFSRRLVRDKAKLDLAREDGKDGGNPELRRGTVPKGERNRPFKRSDAPQKTMRIFNRTQGKCHWCGTELVFKGTGIEPNQFHVDHVVAICDGGTNDEGNLVAACAVCNHRRAREDAATVSVGTSSDHNPADASDTNPSPPSDTKVVRETIDDRRQTRVVVVGAGEPAVGFIAIFDEQRTAIFGEAQARAYPHANDLSIARRWWDAGADDVLVAEACSSVMRQKLAAGTGPPDSLKYLDKPVANAIATRKQPMPEGTVNGSGSRPRQSRDGFVELAHELAAEHGAGTDD